MPVAQRKVEVFAHQVGQPVAQHQRDPHAGVLIAKGVEPWAQDVSPEVRCGGNADGAGQLGAVLPQAFGAFVQCLQRLSCIP